jgi:hypothetical protein
LNSVFDLERVDLWNPTRTSAVQSRSPTMKRELRGKKFRSGWSVVRSESLAKGGTWKKRPSPHLHNVPTRNNKVSPRTLYHVTLCHWVDVKILATPHFLDFRMRHPVPDGGTSVSCVLATRPTTRPKN